MMKFSKKLVMLLTASVLAVTPAVQTYAAPVQIEQRAKKEVAISQSELELKVGETAKLKVTGTKKKVKWSSSDKAIVTVDKKGKVTAIADGLATITAKVGKNEYTCSVNVWSQEFVIDETKLEPNSSVIWYHGGLFDKEAIYYIDGEQITSDVWYDDDGDSQVRWNNPLQDGEHVFAIKKLGFKTYTFTFNYTAPVYNELFIYDPVYHNDEDGRLVSLILNPSLYGKTFSIKLDEKDVSPKWDPTLTGDGFLIVWLDGSELSVGKHEVTVSAEGFDTETREFTVE